MSASIFRRTAASNFTIAGGKNGGVAAEKVKVGKFAGKKIQVLNRKGSSYS